MKIEVMFPRTMIGQNVTTVEVAQIPHEGECLQIEGDDRLWFAATVIHYADYNKGAPVAQVRVK